MFQQCGPLPASLKYQVLNKKSVTVAMRWVSSWTSNRLATVTYLGQVGAHLTSESTLSASSWPRWIRQIWTQSGGVQWAPDFELLNFFTRQSWSSGGYLRTRDHHSRSLFFFFFFRIEKLELQNLSLLAYSTGLRFEVERVICCFNIWHKPDHLVA